MKWYFRILISVFLLGGSTTLPGLSQSLSKTNVSHAYDPDAPVQLHSRVARSGGDAIVFLELINQSGVEIPSVRYELRDSYASETAISNQTLSSEQLIKQEENTAYYRFNVPLQENANYVFLYLTVSVAGASLPLRFDVPLNTDQNFPLSSLLLMRASEDIPVFSNYVNASTAVRIVSFDDSDSVAYAYYYNHDFGPNPSPLGTSSEVQPKLTVDSLLQVSLNSTMRLEQPGLYFAQLDTTSLSGISFRVEDAYYPRLVQAEALVEPIRYISTSEEISELREGETPKLELDKFWMRAARSQDRAKVIIRNYYRQVAKANHFFTTYKEGWKTGMGMIYTLYGKPDDVYRDDEKEVWIYAADNTLVNTSFTFMKVKNIFTDQHYNLMRDEAFERFWYRNIDLWRKGRKTL
ncbi:GWxTD domain-containing protein [Tunicatimonas pelagia]|uniref:GWxTD domain-containing protein n=1 Tax=Tunicatimonas pelagia TaxID=931531 RepID=UPI002666534B|nr:GWxTD domain-containing protein [Tunicatimonas pelagia]WKN41454.1 GWxTD domain-containing protein [Tunicatimonas pelagia]